MPQISLSNIAYSEAENVLAIVSNPQSLGMWRVPQRNYFMVRRILHTSRCPNCCRQQLFFKGTMTHDMEQVNEGYVLHAIKLFGVSQNAIWQFSFADLAQARNKASQYSRLVSEQFPPKNISLCLALLRAKWTFWKHYLSKLGLFVGWVDFMIALGNFEGTSFRFARTLEMRMGDAWTAPKE